MNLSWKFLADRIGVVGWSTANCRYNDRSVFWLVLGHRVVCAFILALFAFTPVAFGKDSSDKICSDCLENLAPEEIVRLVDQQLLTSGVSAGPGVLRVTKWERPISYYLFPRNTDVKTEIDEFLGQISRITGLDISKAENSADANFHILLPENIVDFEQFVDMWKVEGRVTNTTCACSVRRDKSPPNSVARAVLFAPPTRGKLGRQICVRRIVSTCLGINRGSELSRTRNHIPANDLIKFYTMSETEILGLRTLYTPEIKDQMLREQVLYLLGIK